MLFDIINWLLYRQIYWPRIELGLDFQSWIIFILFEFQNDLSAPLKIDSVDSSSGVLLPSYDHDTKVMYVAGKVRPKSNNIF